MYSPKGAARELFGARDPEVLLEGPAGTGKSRAWLERLHLVASRYPACRLLICRKTRASLSESALVTFERDVLPAGHPAREGARRSGRRGYVYPNGSEILVAGLDRPSKILSTEFDLVFVQEATELQEEDWETLLTRLRNGRLPYQQLGGDCNPDRPSHWLNQRCLAGQTRRLVSRHEDNPVLWDGREWTPAGRTYRAKLEALSGARRARFLEGRWAASEGLVYPEWDAARHLVDPFAVPTDWRRIWVVDFGFVNPFVWQEWAVDGDGRAYRLREIYRTRRLVVDHAREILKLKLPGPEAIVCDHDAEGRATLESALGRRTMAADKRVLPGLEAVSERLREGRLQLVRGGLVARDPELVAARKPCSSEEEVDSYVWETTRESPRKEDDHGMDAWRYLAMYLAKGTRGARSWQGA